MKEEHDYDLLELRVQLLEGQLTCLIQGMENLLTLSHYFNEQIEEIQDREQNLYWDD